MDTKPTISITVGKVLKQSDIIRIIVFGELIKRK